MNYHSDEWIMEKLQEHYNEALEYFSEDRIVAILLQGSQNYQMDTERSDVDTKLVVLPTFEDICFNKKPVSTTHVRANDEHIDFKDIRLMFETFRKQNVNFVEVLFTKYKIINPLYEKEWNRLVQENERVAHYSPYRAVTTMKGLALEKYYAMEHPYPSKIELIEKYGYDPKQLSHLVRMCDFIESYIAGKPYQECLTPIHIEDIVNLKLYALPLEEAREMADFYKNKVSLLGDNYRETHENTCDEYVDKLLNDVLYNIMFQGITKELIHA